MMFDKKILCLLKFVLIAYLMSTVESKNICSRSYLALKRYQKNSSMIKSRLNIEFQDVLQLSLGIISGFIKQKYHQIKTALKITKEISILTYETLNSSFSKCLQTAKEDSQPKSAEFEAFISVMPSQKRDNIMKSIISGCTDKNEKKISTETENQIKRIKTVIEGDGMVDDVSKRISRRKNKVVEITQRKIDLEAVKKILAYFNQDDRYKIAKALVTVNRTVCDYLDNKNDNWFDMFSRWIKYSLSLLNCGAGSLVKEFISNNDKYQETFKQLLIKAFNALYKINYLVLIKFVWNVVYSLLEGNSSYFAVGEGLGRELAENINLTSLGIFRKKF